MEADEAPAGPSIVENRRRKVKPGKRALKERQPALDLEENAEYTLPPLALLVEADGAGTAPRVTDEALRQNAEMLVSVLEDFRVFGEVTQVQPGPVVTLYELEPQPGTRTSRVIGLADDIARSMSAISVRAATIPGRSVIGIELPNGERETVLLRELLASAAYENDDSSLTLALGKDIGGKPVVADLARMPHLLVAGTTGSGKSVAINSMILSLVYRLPPDRCKLILIDPKMLELSVYDDIPHLLAPVVTEPAKAVVALKWTVREMEARYKSMSRLGVRNIAGYNKRLAEAREKGERLTWRVNVGMDAESGAPIHEEFDIDLTPMPFIVVVVDEMADLMLVAGKDIEGAVQRLAQMARAAGIHLIMATQRPSVDVITGTIKANFPTRISFQVTSKIDSRTILGDGRRRAAAGPGRHALSRLRRARHAGARALRQRRRSRACHRLHARERASELCRGRHRGARIGRHRDGRERRRGPALRPGRGAGRCRAQGLYQLRSTPSADRLQPRCPNHRTDGERRGDQPGQPCRQARGAGLRPFRRLIPERLARFSRLISALCGGEGNLPERSLLGP